MKVLTDEKDTEPKRHSFSIKRWIILNRNSEMKVLTDEKDTEPKRHSLFPNILLKIRGNLLIRGKLSSLN